MGVKQRLPLIEAIGNGQVSRAIELLEQGANCDEVDQDYKWTPLHLCARDGKVALTRLLIQHGATVDARDSIGQTPLHRAAYWGKLEVVSALLCSGADFTALDHMLQTPEELATQQGHTRVAELLQQTIMLFLENGLPSAPFDRVEQMRRQVNIKEKEERKRRELWELARRKEEEQERREEKARKEERKLREKREELADRIAALEDEIAQLLRLHQGPPQQGSRDAVRMKVLQGRRAKLSGQLEDQRHRTRAQHHKSLADVPLLSRGDAWLAFINSY